MAARFYSRDMNAGPFSISKFICSDSTHKNDEHVGSVVPLTNDRTDLATRVPFSVVFLKSKRLLSKKLSPEPSARIIWFVGLIYI